MDGLFKINEPTKKVSLLMSPPCGGACKLIHTCNSPKMPIDGEGKKKILVIAEAPGETEDKQGIPLCGKTGQYLESTLADFGIDMRRDCWITNVLRCRPPSNRTPTDQEIAWCRPWLVSKSPKYGELFKLNPRIIILLGGIAVKSLLGWLWKEDPDGINRWAGWKIPSQQLNCWVAPTWHPSYVVREEKNPVVSLIWKRHLEAAVSLRGRPWPEGAPDYASRVTVEMVPRQAAHLIREITRLGKAAAFDYETTMLKPDGPKAEIVTCAISNGLITVAYPWHGEAIKATQDFLRSPVPKIGTNVKFEDRWTRKILGHKVRNIVFDTMLAAHYLDNRPGVTSIKFQAFVQLGQPSWDDEIKPYFESAGPNIPNRIWELYKKSPHKVLLYNGLDAILEHEVAQIQAKQIGLSLDDPDMYRKGA